jgi:hypothetical protein
MATRTAMGMLATATAVLAFPAGAAAEYFVPPSNSAATQYTETLPTAGGHHDSEKGRKGHRSPKDVLGKRNAHRLDKQGAAGREVAEVVAATAPPTEAGEPQPAAPIDRTSEDRDRREKRERPPAETGGAGGPGPSGSSGLGKVLGQATGVSASGQLGLLLPLAIAAAAAWALAFLMRKRNRPTS